MKPTFVCQTIYTKAICRECGSAAQRKRNLLWGLFGCSVVLLGIYLFNSLIGNTVVRLLALFAGVLFLAYFLLSGRLIGYRLYRANRDNATVFRFGEDNYTVKTNMTDFMMHYDTITDVMETDALFLLLLGKNGVQILPKDGFSVGGTADFRCFISEKTHLPVRGYSKWSLFVPTVATICAAAVTIAGFAAIRSYKDHPAVLTDNGYTITLTNEFHLLDTDPYDFEAAAFHTRVVAQQHSAQDIAEVYMLHNPTEEELIQTIAGGCIYSAQDVQIKLLSDGSSCVSMLYDDGTGNKRYRLCTVRLVNGSYWLTEFSCPTSNQGEYAAKFEKWAQTVVIG